MIAQSEIRKILPHRFPMLLVDSLIDVKPGVEATGIKNITCNEPCYMALSDDMPPVTYAYPRSLMMESFCQTAGILYRISQSDNAQKNDLMLFGSITKFVFYRRLYPGDTMTHYIKMEKSLDDAAVFSGTITEKEMLVAKVGNIVIAFRKSNSTTNIQT